MQLPRRQRPKKQTPRVWSTRGAGVAILPGFVNGRKGCLTRMKSRSQPKPECKLFHPRLFPTQARACEQSRRIFLRGGNANTDHAGDLRLRRIIRRLALPSQKTAAHCQQCQHIAPRPGPLFAPPCGKDVRHGPWGWEQSFPAGAVSAPALLLVSPNNCEPPSTPRVDLELWWAPNAKERGFLMPCELRVNPILTKDGRRICGKPGRFYTIAGAVGKLVIFACTRHARRLERVGLSVIQATPLEAAAFHEQREIYSTFCTCKQDPFSCPIEAHAIEARQKEIRSA